MFPFFVCFSVFFLSETYVNGLARALLNVSSLSDASFGHGCVGIGAETGQAEFLFRSTSESVIER